MSFSESGSSSNSQKKAIFFWCLGGLFFGYEFLLRVSPNVMQKELQNFFHIDAWLMGNLSSAYYYGYALLQIPSGILIDRYGARIFLAIGSLLCGAGAILMTVSDVYCIAWIGRFIIGGGSAFALVGTLKISVEWFSAERYGFLTGLTLMIGTLGALVGGAPLAKSVEVIGWKETLIFAGIAGCILALIIYIFVRDKKKASAVDKKGQGIAFKEILIVLKNPQSWIAGIFGGVLYMPIGAFGELWGTPYLVQLCSCSRTEATATLASIFAGLTVGGPFCGWLSDTLRRRKLVALAGTIIALLISLIIILGPITTLLPFFILMFLLGVVLGSQILMFPIIRELNPPHVSGFTVGFCNTIAMFIASTAQPVVGLFLDILNKGTVIRGVYSLESIRMSLMVIPGTLAITFIMMLFVKETYARPMEAFNR